MTNKEELLPIEEKLLDRIEPMYGRWISCGRGWYRILEELDAKLSYLYPEYKIAQVKEKFGTLRFYLEGEPFGIVGDLMDDAIRQAEVESGKTCEICGNSAMRGGDGWVYDGSVGTRARGGWYKTVCDNCGLPLGYAPYKEQWDYGYDDCINDLKTFYKRNELDLPNGLIDYLTGETSAI
jgi:hypothetical protein